MTDLYSIYRNSPVFLQNIFATGYGLKELLVRHGGKYPEFVRQLDEAQWWPADRMHEYQNERLHALIEFCSGRVPYYQDLFRSLGLTPRDIQSIEDLTKLPLLEKETVRLAPERFIPRPFHERLIPQTTGGTTGKPLRYYVSPTAVQYNYAAYEVRFRRWAGVKFGEKFASINGKPIVPAGQISPPFWRHNLAFHQLYLSAYHMSEKNLPHYISCLKKFKPQFIVGYVSTVHVLARFILSHQLEGEIRPKAILVSSETLFDWIRADIEKAFQCKVFNGYGLGEMTALITECPNGSMHISPEYGVVETPQIEQNMEIVSTGLFNFAMPLLRYRTGDIVQPATKQKCECGRALPMVGNITGRIDDRIITPEGAIIGPATLSLVFQAIPNLIDAQIEQNDASEIKINMVTQPSFNAANEQALLTEIRNRLGNKLRVQLHRVAEIPRTSGGKQRLIISGIKNSK